MDFYKIIKQQQEAFVNASKKADKKELQFLTDKDTFRGKCFGFLTSNYYKRKKLVLMGELVYGYTFKTWSNNVTSDNPYPTWVMFSPDSSFLKNPMQYSIVIDRVMDFISNEKLDKKYRKFKTLISEPLAEPSYLIVPSFLTNDRLVYISLVYIRPKQFPSFKEGINIMIMNQNISSEILYLPEKYFIKEYKEVI